MDHIIGAIEAEVHALKAHGPRAFLDWAGLDSAVADARKAIVGDPQPEPAAEPAPAVEQSPAAVEPAASEAG